MRMLGVSGMSCQWMVFFQAVRPGKGVRSFSDLEVSLA